MGYSKGYDKLMFHVGTHRVMCDKLQIVIQHPKSCPRKGSPLDSRKTFYPGLPVFDALDRCGVLLTEEQQAQISEKSRYVAVVPR